MGAARLDPPDVTGVRPPRLLGADADLDDDAGLSQAPVAGASDLRIGINKRGDHARDAGSDDGVDTRPCPAVMRAWLERDVQRRPARCRTGAAQRLGLRVRPPTRLRPAAANDHAIFDDDRADGGIGPGASQPVPAERERQRHEAGVFRTMIGIAQWVQLLSGRPITLYQARQGTREFRR